MAVRKALAKAVKGTLVAFAIVGGGALAAPGSAAAAPNGLEPVPGPVVRAVVDCAKQTYLDGIEFDCIVWQGAIRAVIWCSDGSFWYYDVVGPAREQFELFCPDGTVMTRWRVYTS